MSEREQRTPDTSGPDRGKAPLSAQEAADSLGVHERTIRRAIARGTLPAVKRSGVWRIDANDLVSFTPGQRGQIARSRHIRPSLSLVPPAPPFMVPVPRNPLIGREREIAAVTAMLLDSRAPLVTLTGPGGSGKTRLALAVAAFLRDRFTDGVWFVDLSALRDPDLVPGAIVQALHLREIAGETALNRLRGYLQSRSLLLVLDNVEQVIAAAPAIGDLLVACPNLQALATSRTPLHLSMEQQFRVTPLDFPRTDWPPGREDVESAPAARLFRQAARRVRSDFEITDANAVSVAILCVRLDGLPLAIELAAAQIGMYAPHALLERLDSRFGLLDHGPRDAPPRLRSMRDAIGWSYDLLDGGLQQRFRRLTVFDGGFTAGSAAEVTSDSPRDVATFDADLRALVDANLVVAHPEASRFTLLETIREFGREELESSGEADSLRETHARWCIDLLTAARNHWFTPNQTEWGDLIEREHANMRAALASLDARDRHEAVVELAGLMWPFWFVRSHWLEGVTWLRRALDLSAGQHTFARIRVLTGAGCLWLMIDDLPAATAFNEESLALCNEIGHANPPDSPLNGLAICANARGDFEEGHRLNLECLAMLRACDDSVPSALPLVSVILTNMAATLLRRGRVEESEPLAHEAIQMQRELGFDWAAADTLLILARIAQGKGEHEYATACYRESFGRSVQSRDPLAIVTSLDHAARLLASAGDDERFAILLGASDRLHEIVADAQDDERRAEREQYASRARVRFGDDIFNRLYRHGQGMPPEELLAVALEASVPPSSRRVPAAAARWGLTHREFDVLGLVAQGLTDQEIADTLYIGRRTVHTHVSRLLAKLGARNRRDAVARARAEHLLDDSPPS